MRAGPDRRGVLRGTAAGALGLTSMALPAALAHASAIGSAGAAYGGGTYVGIIDTIGFSGSDYAYEPGSTGLRYALVVCPQAYEPATNLTWGPAGWYSAAAASRWDGLGNTTAVTAAAGAGIASTHPLFAYCAAINANTATGLRGSPADTRAPSDGGSEWYVPAIDELELIYRTLKPTADANSTGTYNLGVAIGSASRGYNPSSSPAGTAYSSGSPAQTSVTSFRQGGEEAVDVVTFSSRSAWWTSTVAPSSQGSVFNIETIGSTSGAVNLWGTGDTAPRVRLVRRVPLS